jgi:hypothetical protein
MFLPAAYNFSAVSAYCWAQWGVLPDPLSLSRHFNFTSNSSSNIIFSNGHIDPWFVGGILADLSSSLVTFLIEGAAHHLDLRGSAPSDPPAVIAARLQMDAIISSWLADN